MNYKLPKIPRFTENSGSDAQGSYIVADIVAEGHVIPSDRDEYPYVQEIV